ncbi:MAG: hypothetical protein M3N59_01950 [bacterium]|nr:hypothetical protein [bacterium]
MSTNTENTLVAAVIVAPVALLARLNRPISRLRAGFWGTALGGVAGGAALATTVVASHSMWDPSVEDLTDGQLEETAASFMIGGLIGGYFGLIFGLLVRVFHR